MGLEKTGRSAVRDRERMDVGEEGRSEYGKRPYGLEYYRY